MRVLQTPLNKRMLEHVSYRKLSTDVKKRKKIVEGTEGDTDRCDYRESAAHFAPPLFHSINSSPAQ